MPEVSLYLLPLLGLFKKTELENLRIIVSAMLCMSGNKTMLNISRWTIGELSYKTIERFYNQAIPWLDMNIKVLFLNLKNPQELLLSGDETKVTKSGKKTYGIDYFFNSIYQKTMRSLCFSGISLIDVEKNKAYSLLLSQLVFSESEKEVLKKKKDSKEKNKGGKRGPKTGSKNSAKKETELAPSFRLLKSQLEEVVKKIKGNFSIRYFVGDGGYGNSTVAKICDDLSLFLVSKLQYNAALYFKFTGQYSGKGRKRIYGDKVDYNKLPEEYLCKTEIDTKESVITQKYQMKCLHKEFKQELNIVTNKQSHVVFFTTALELHFEKIIQYYSSRFQIEFNFRDAKQFWGLEDFMNVKETPVQNAANLSFFMGNISNIALSDFRKINNNKHLGIRDLISAYRANRYVSGTLKLVQESNPNFLLPKCFDIINSLGRIHL
jgi:putative transposase